MIRSENYSQTADQHFPELLIKATVLHSWLSSIGRMCRRNLMEEQTDMTLTFDCLQYQGLPVRYLVPVPTGTGSLLLYQATILLQMASLNPDSISVYFVRYKDNSLYHFFKETHHRHVHDSTQLRGLVPSNFVLSRKTQRYRNNHSLSSKETPPCWWAFFLDSTTSTMTRTSWY